MMMIIIIMIECDNNDDDVDRSIDYDRSDDDDFCI